MRQVNRITPQMPAANYTTFAISAPLATHHRQASCQEVECEAYANGWVTRIDTASDLGAKQANYIRLRAGRAFTAAPIAPDASIVEFTFPPGQQCFRTHHVPLEREPLYTVRGGDWRGDPRGEGVRWHASGDDWVDQFANHQDRLAARLAQG